MTELVAKSHRGIAGLVKGTTWGTSVLVAAGHGFEMGPSGESIEGSSTLIVDDSLHGGVQERQGDAGNRVFAGDLQMPMLFDYIHRLLAYPMGVAGVPAEHLEIRTGVNDKLDFTEGTTGAAVATLTAGEYTPATLATEIQTQMDAAATDNTYTVSFSTNKFTIARNVGTDTIDLNWSTGPNASTSVGLTMGYVVTADDTSATTYLADNNAPVMYKHVLKIGGGDESLEGLFFTLISGMPGVGVREFTSAKFNGFTLSVASDDKWQASFPTVAHNGVFDDSGLNKKSTLAAITRVGNEIARSLFKGSTVRLNQQSAAALAVADAISLTNISVVLANNLRVDEYTTEFGDRISEPIRQGMVKVNGEFPFSRVQASNFADQIQGLGKTPMKSDVVVIGQDVSASQRYLMKFYFPSLQFDVSGNTLSGGIVGKTIGYEAQSVAAIPNGFPTGYTDALTIEIVNTSNADPFA